MKKNTTINFLQNLPIPPKNFSAPLARLSNLKHISYHKKIIFKHYEKEKVYKTCILYVIFY